MRKLLGTVVLGLIVLGLIGLVRGWFSLSTNSESDQTKIELTIDKDRLKQDTDRIKGGFHELSEKIQSRSVDGSDESTRPVLPPSGNESTRSILPPGVDTGRQF